MGLFKEKKAVIYERPNQELADAYEAIALLYEQVTALTAEIVEMKGGIQ